MVHSRALQLIMQHCTNACPCLQDHSLAYVMSSTSKEQGVSLVCRAVADVHADQSRGNQQYYSAKSGYQQCCKAWHSCQ